MGSESEACVSDRETNKAVDFLAFLGHYLPLGLHTYFEAPVSLKPIPAEDA